MFSTSPRARAWGLGLAVVAGFGLAYGSVLSMLVYQWWTNDMYNYGFLIPLISGYVVWNDRARVAAELGNPAVLPGLTLLVLGLGLLTTARAGSLLALQELSILPTLLGLALLLGGYGLLRVVWLPIAYLLFMIPVWEPVTSHLHLPFQQFSASIGAGLLQLVGVPTFRDGTFLYLPGITLEVAKACSGANYLIAILSVSIPLAYMSLRSNRRRIAVVVFAVTIAMLGNGLRVALVGFTQHFSWFADVHGPGHVLHGTAVAVLGYAALFIAIGVFGEFSSPTAAPLRVSMRPKAWAAMATAVMLLLIAGATQPLLRAEPVSMPAGVGIVPYQIGQWTGANGRVADSAVHAAAATDEVVRAFRHPEIGLAHFYVGYLPTQAQGRELVWYGDTGVPISDQLIVDDAVGRIEVSEGVTEASGRRRYVVFGYAIGGRITSSPYRVKALTMWTTLRHRRSNGALVAVTVEPQPGVDESRVRAATLELVRGLFPSVQRAFDAS